MLIVFIKAYDWKQILTDSKHSRPEILHLDINRGKLFLHIIFKPFTKTRGVVRNIVSVGVEKIASTNKQTIISRKSKIIVHQVGIPYHHFFFRKYFFNLFVR